jgi:hypothetical protein
MTRRALTIAPWTVAFWPSDWVASPAKKGVESNGAPNSAPPTAAAPRENGSACRGTMSETARSAPR